MDEIFTNTTDTQITPNPDKVWLLRGVGGRGAVTLKEVTADKSMVFTGGVSANKSDVPQARNAAYKLDFSDIFGNALPYKKGFGNVVTLVNLSANGNISVDNVGDTELVTVSPRSAKLAINNPTSFRINIHSAYVQFTLTPRKAGEMDVEWEWDDPGLPGVMGG